EIMKMRFGEELKWNITLPNVYENVKIPKLLIQPLVENSVLHGAENKIGRCNIEIMIEPVEESNSIRIMVKDDGVGMSEQKLKNIQDSLQQGGIPSGTGKGIAISNVYKRLLLYYKAEKDVLVINSVENKGTIISFMIPIDGGM
ncbi:MAG TPA: ATP-binding protein, partial [Niallia sp.]|nr:ATP-binding protein [Niallia sp.]